MSAYVRIRWLLSAAVLASAPLVPLRAGEKVELRGSTAIELPKPKRNLEETRSRFKFESDGPDVGGFAPPPSTDNTPADRRLREMLDRKKNWIFMNPYESQQDPRTREILGTGDTRTEPLDHPLLRDEEKGLMERFLEERGGRRPADNETTGGAEGARGSRNDRERSDNAQLAGAVRERDEEQPAAIIFGSGKDPSFVKSLDQSLGVTEFQKRMERGPMSGNMFYQQPESARNDADERRQQEIREAEFNKLVQPRGLATLPTLGGQLEPLSSSDPTRRDGGLASTRRSGDLFSGGRTDFGAGSRDNSSVSSLPTPGGRDLGEIGSRRGTQPAYAPPPLQSAAPQSAFGPKPFVFEMPRRKF